MKIAMVGSGYVGLVSGACFADFGHDVVCIDKDQSKIDRLHDGVMPIYEPGLDELVESQRQGGPAVVHHRPGRRHRGRRGDLHRRRHAQSPRRRACRPVLRLCRGREMGETLENDAVVVTKSTVPVGTGDEVERIIAESGTGTGSRWCPTPSSCARARRSAISSVPTGSSSAPRTNSAARSCARSTARCSSTNRRSCSPAAAARELIKYAANAFLATKIMFINEMADLCEKVGANVQDVSRGIGMDKRIGPKFLHAGPGYGGSCFPKDTLALLKTAEDYDSPIRIVEAVVKANDSRKRAMGRKVLEALGGADTARGKRVALLGLTFKPNTDDMRDQPGNRDRPGAERRGRRVTAYDPEGMELAEPLMPGW